MELKDKTIDLAVGTNIHQWDRAFITMNRRDLNKDLLTNVSGLSTQNGLHLNDPGWKNCLGSTTSETSRNYFYIAFPSQWRAAEDIERWCTFLKNHYNLDTHYVGEVFLSGGKYGVDDTYQVRSHIISVDRQEDLYKCSEYSILLKVTLLRFLYRTLHFSAIIQPLYEMVETAGINPWDAMVLAHYHGQTLKLVGYASERALLYDLNTNGLSMMWPRSYEELKNMFKAFKLINGVWATRLSTLRRFFNANTIPEFLFLHGSYYNMLYERRFLISTSDNLEASLFKEPHCTIFIESTLKPLLVKRAWKEVHQAYLEFIKSYEPIIKIISDDPKRYMVIAGGLLNIPTSVGNYLYINDKEPVYLNKFHEFLKSL